MAINGDYTRMNPADPNGSAKPVSQARKAASPRKTVNTAAKASKKPASDAEVHNQARLRESVSQLIDDGDIASRDNGTVRPARVAAARQHVESGDYSQSDVLASIVDRLLDQWKI